MSNELKQKCKVMAKKYVLSGFNEYDYREDDLTDLFYKLELEKIEKDKKSDELLDYNDEIVSIEEMGELETIDISVSGDNLFYCNDILTKNSFGLPATADWFLAINRDEELDKFKQVSCKQLKNRYTNLTLKKRFILGVDLMKQSLFDVDDATQKKSLEILSVKGKNPQTAIQPTQGVIASPVEDKKDDLFEGGAKFNFS